METNRRSPKTPSEVTSDQWGRFTVLDREQLAATQGDYACRSEIMIPTLGSIATHSPWSHGRIGFQSSDKRSSIVGSIMAIMLECWVQCLLLLSQETE